MAAQSCNSETASGDQAMKRQCGERQASLKAALLAKLSFATDAIEICKLVLKIQAVEGFQNSRKLRNYLLCLAISCDQYLGDLAHFASLHYR